jgi:hypothetical protein
MGHEDIRDNDHARSTILEIKAMGGWITRLDFFVDIAEKTDLATFYEYMREIWKTKQGRNRIGEPSYWTSPSGDTVYVGKRASDRMLRVYDKRAEILKRKDVDIGFGLTRFECEIKRKAVHRYETLFLAGQERVIVADMAARWAIPQICDNPEKMEPLESGRELRNPMAFVRRYSAIISEAYTDAPDEFMEVVKCAR